MEGPEVRFQLRCAVPDDIPAIRALIELSVRALQAEDYSPAQMEGALGTVFGVDTQLIADGTYFVVEAQQGEQHVLAGCGGWSKRKTLFGGDRLGDNPGSDREDSLLDPRMDRAKIRAFFVHPDWARRGLGTMILDASENAAAQAGFTGFELGATLTGEKLYRTKGYQAIDRIEVPLANGVSLPVIRMSKAVAPRSSLNPSETQTQ